MVAGLLGPELHAGLLLHVQGRSEVRGGLELLPHQVEGGRILEHLPDIRITEERLRRGASQNDRQGLVQVHAAEAVGHRLGEQFADDEGVVLRDRASEGLLVVLTGAGHAVGTESLPEVLDDRRV